MWDKNIGWALTECIKNGQIVDNYGDIHFIYSGSVYPIGCDGNKIYFSYYHNGYKEVELDPYFYLIHFGL